MSSFLSQYGIRISTREFMTVSWDEFRSLLAGIAPETALGRVAAIRAETDKNVIAHFSKDQKRIYDAWNQKAAQKMSVEKYEAEMQDLESMFAMLCGQSK